MMKAKYVIVFLAMSLVFATAPAQAADLKVTINGLVDATGVISVALLDGPEGFPRNREALSARRVSANSGVVEIVFTALKPGVYAVAVYHDADDDGELNSNFLGMPTEAYGFSNDARGNFGPPSFADAAVTLDESNKTIAINLSK